MDLQYQLAAPPPSTTKMFWRAMSNEIADLVDDPTAVTLIVTDDFARVVADLQPDVPWEYGGAAKADSYDPQKADGSRAGAKTLPLANRTVIVVDAAAAILGNASMRRVIHHEAQHVRLRQGGDDASAAHRRHEFQRPLGFPFDFVYLAQSMLDEYRCEAAVSPEFLAANDVMSVQPDGWPAVESLFTRARRDYRLTGDLGAAYAGVLTALDRFASFAGYAVASIARGRYTRHQWSDAPAVLLVDDLRRWWKDLAPAAC